MTAYERKQQIVIEQKQDKIEALIEGYREIMRQLQHNQSSQSRTQKVRHTLLPGT